MRKRFVAIGHESLYKIIYCDTVYYIIKIISLNINYPYFNKKCSFYHFCYLIIFLCIEIVLI